jgi:hypothetical protein
LRHLHLFLSSKLHSGEPEGKLKYWAPGKDYHYHCTLAAGENTLEAQLVRVLMKSITATG